MATLIRPNGIPEEVKGDLKNGKFTLDRVQELVGGYIIPFPLEGGRVMLVDEDAEMKHLPINHGATEVVRATGRLKSYAHEQVLGKVLIVDRRTEFNV